MDKNLGDPKKWTVAHDEGCRWGLRTTNHVEAFNGVLKGARNTLITASVELIFYCLVKYFDKYGLMATQDERNHLKFQRDWQNTLEKSQKQTLTNLGRLIGIFHSSLCCIRQLKS